VSRRDPRQARALGLWTAGWLFALLLAGLVWIGDLGIQWPVLAVPVLWALLALRPRGGRPALRRRDPREDSRAARRRDDDGPADDDLEGWPPQDRPSPHVPPTRELPWLPQVPRDRRHD
jgi:hypothetical protein